MRRFLIQLLLFPIRLPLFLLTSFGMFVVGIGAAICNILSVIFVLCAVTNYIWGPLNYVPCVVLAWLFSPYGLPAIALGMITLLEFVNERLGELG